MTKEESLRLWNDNYCGLSKNERIRISQKWIKYWDLIAGDSDASTYPTAVSIVDYLKREGLLNGNPSILDIGCGTGRYSLLFGQNGATITAIDMSAKVLGILSERAAALNLHINTAQAMWELFEPCGKYDMVFSSLCPGICDEESLLKMEFASKRFCVLVGVGAGSCAKSRAELRMRLTDKRLAGLSPDIIYIYNYLYSTGRTPNVRNFAAHYQSATSTDEAVNIFQTYYSIFGIEGAGATNVIVDYAKEHSIGGQFIHDQNMINALVWWEVKM